MNTIPVISVIVPIYKVEKYLPQCIDSILAQTFTNFELLLVDDGSPDRCGDICEEYARRDERIRVFHQENAGLSCARNVGLENSSGRYISFIDSDDYVKSYYLEALYNALPENKSLMGVVVGGLDKISPSGDIRTVHVPKQDVWSKDKYLIVTDLIDKNVSYAASKLYDNRLIELHDIKFVPSISGLEDLLFMLDYLIYSDFLFIRDYNNYVYRVGYSTEVLSVRINSFDAEYAAFLNFLNRVYMYQDKFGLEDESLTRAWNSLTVFFHKIILSIYKVENNYSRKTRLRFLSQILSINKQWINNFFSPQYFADKCGKFLLCCINVSVFDFWMQILLLIKFKKMFGAK
ncbi:glycosyltransferase [Bacteroides sp.]|uniref:glycosyltransferase family 2 protein n=1 Tax=Bacteroides sp. TaxID=29523 RepID=UPI00262B22C6|nr:glycosyltransferase [Bacteroides sp.]